MAEEIPGCTAPDCVFWACLFWIWILRMSARDVRYRSIMEHGEGSNESTEWRFLIAWRRGGGVGEASEGCRMESGVCVYNNQ